MSKAALSPEQRARVDAAAWELDGVLAELVAEAGPDGLEGPEHLTAIDLQNAIHWARKAQE
jgi:hypothetical protein